MSSVKDVAVCHYCWDQDLCYCSYCQLERGYLWKEAYWGKAVFECVRISTNVSVVLCALPTQVLFSLSAYVWSGSTNEDGSGAKAVYFLIVHLYISLFLSLICKWFICCPVLLQRAPSKIENMHHMSQIWNTVVPLQFKTFVSMKMNWSKINNYLN